MNTLNWRNTVNADGTFNFGEILRIAHAKATCERNAEICFSKGIRLPRVISLSNINAFYADQAAKVADHDVGPHSKFFARELRNAWQTARGLRQSQRDHAEFAKLPVREQQARQYEHRAWCAENAIPSRPQDVARYTAIATQIRQEAA